MALRNVVIDIAYALDPSFSVNISPPLLTGNSGEDAIELSCTLLVTEDVISATYQFTWIKDDTPIDLSDNRIMVHIYTYLYLYIMIIYTQMCVYIHIHVLCII